MPAFNAEFARPAREDGSAFVAMRGPEALDDILCEVHERVVGRDNCVRFDRLTLQIEADGGRPHYVKAKVKVRRHMDGSLSVWHGASAAAALRRGRDAAPEAPGGGRLGGPRRRPFPPPRRGPRATPPSLPRGGGKGRNPDRETGQFICSKTGHIYLLPT